MASAALTLVLLVLAGGRVPGSFPHSGDHCKDSCAFGKMACEKECLPKGAVRDAKALACLAGCAKEVPECEATCKELMPQVEKQIRELPKKDPAEKKKKNQHGRPKLED